MTDSYHHEALPFGSDQALLDVVVPFLIDGAERDEPVYVALSAANAARAQQYAGRLRGVTYLTEQDAYRRPATAIEHYRRLWARDLDEGAKRVRLLGELPAAAFGNNWRGWARYESTLNHAWQDFPVWSICAYDTRLTSPEILADVRRTHPYAAVPGGDHTAHTEYRQPEQFAAELARTQTAPLAADDALITLADPTPFVARQALEQLNHEASFAAVIDSARLAVSEAVSNAWRHGRPPVTVRCWTSGDQLLITVTDRGPGVVSPFAGLLRPAGMTEGGRGLWLIGQICDHLGFRQDDNGFTISLVLTR